MKKLFHILDQTNSHIFSFSFVFHYRKEDADCWQVVLRVSFLSFREETALQGGGDVFNGKHPLGCCKGKPGIVIIYQVDVRDSDANGLVYSR